MKNTDFGRGSKAGHLSYLGDSEVGEGVNIGAGTITCNYDGVRKNRTVIEAGAFIGSGTELVAPGQGRPGGLCRRRLGDHQGRLTGRPGRRPRPPVREDGLGPAASAKSKSGKAITNR